MHNNLNRSLLIVIAILLGVGPFATGIVAAAQTNTGAANLDATFAAEWMQTAYDHVRGDSVNAPAASRVYAYLGVALYESVVGGLPGYTPLHTLLKDMPAAPELPSGVIDWPSVANATLSNVMKHLLPTDDSVKAADDLRAKQTATRTRAATKAVVDRSLEYGDSIADALLGWIDADGYSKWAKEPYTMPTGEAWMYTPTSAGAKPVGAYWGNLRTFALANVDDCEVPRTVEFSTDENSEFYKYANEVKTVKENLTDAQKLSVNFWIDTPGQTGAPAGHWMSIGTQLVKQFNLKLGKTAEMFALLGMALGDAFISCWRIKYKEPLLRPQTYISRYMQRDWTSYVVTPPFPSYTSGHSTASEAAAVVLTALFGEDKPFTDATHATDAIKIPAQKYKSFDDAAAQAAMSRLYGGIHYRFDNESGLKQGKCVGETVLKVAALHTTS